MKQIRSLFLIFFFLWVGVSAQAKEDAKITLKVILFFSPNCHACQKVKQDFIPRIEEKYKQKFVIDHRNIEDVENYKMLVALKKQYNVENKSTVPVVFLNGEFLFGREDIEENLERLIDQALVNPVTMHHRLSPVDLTALFLAFSPLTIISAGLIDGINPCAFAVIIFFISFLALQGYRKKEVFTIGLSFVISVFVAYLLIGMGLFSSLYHLKAFWQVAKAINIFIGVLSIIFGILAAYDFFTYKKTKNSELMVLQLPQNLRTRIHAIIGSQYRKGKAEAGGSLKVNLFNLSLRAVITGFLISIIEAVCTGQVYLPTITFVLKTSRYKLEAMGYLLLYNFMFIVPLLIIFLLAVSGTTSEDLAKFFKKHFLLVKVLMLLLFFTLGFYLLWRA